MIQTGESTPLTLLPTELGDSQFVWLYACVGK
jgi:hypothetical protein